jgi:hypothetical protein
MDDGVSRRDGTHLLIFTHVSPMPTGSESLPFIICTSQVKHQNSIKIQRYSTAIQMGFNGDSDGESTTQNIS